MTKVEDLDVKLQIFKWDTKPLEKEPELLDQDSDADGRVCARLFSGLFLFYVGIFSLTTSTYEKEKLFLQLSQFHLPYLDGFETTIKLLEAALKQSRLLRSCNNLDRLAAAMALDLCCKFRFSPAILSGREPAKLIISFDLDILLGEESDDQSLVAVVVGSETVNDECEDSLDHNSDKDKEIHKFVKLRGSTPDFGENEALHNMHTQEGCVRGEGNGGGGIWEVKPNLEINYLGLEGNDDHDEDQICSICLEKICDDRAIVQTVCSHKFHRDCIIFWLLGTNSTNSCPLCRSPCIVAV